MKYIITKYNNVALFSDDLVHRAVAFRLGEEVVAAGFYKYGRAQGCSESLNIGSRPQDTEIINAFLKAPDQRTD